MFEKLPRAIEELMKNYVSDKGFTNDVAAAEKIKMLTATAFAEIFDELIISDLISDLGLFGKRFKTFKEFIDTHTELYTKPLSDANPKFLVFACSDSRVSPSDILGFEPGQAFVVHNIANMVPAYNQLTDSGVAAAIKYAIKTLKVPNILIIGHSPVDGSTDSSDEKCKHCKQAAVSLSLTNLRTYPDVMEKKELQLLGGYFDLTKKTFVLRKQIKPVEQEVHTFSLNEQVRT